MSDHLPPADSIAEEHSSERWDQPFAGGGLANVSARLKAVEASVRQDGPAFWGAQCALPFDQTVVASLIREIEVLMLFLAAQHLLIRDLRDLLPSPSSERKRH